MTLSRHHPILIVDDDPEFREVVRLILHGLPLRVFEASDGREALDALRSRADIELIVTDIDLPVMNGCDLYRAQRADPRLAHIPLVFLSGETVSVVSGSLSGKVHFVQKLDAWDFLRSIVATQLSCQHIDI